MIASRVEIEFLNQLSPEKQIVFMNQMNAARKSKTTAVLLTLFLGGLGAQHFYMGNNLAGILSVLFCWTFLPVIIAFLHLFLISGEVDLYNEQRASEIFKLLIEQSATQV